jgi:hypothetical protein
MFCYLTDRLYMTFDKKKKKKKSRKPRMIFSQLKIRIEKTETNILTRISAKPSSVLKHTEKN